MNAHGGVAAFPASEGTGLVLEKRIHTEVSQLIEVVNQAHSIRGLVAAINVQQSLARILWTLMAE